MKTLYLDLGMGAAGDMLTAALMELLPDPDAFLKELNGIGIPHVTVSGYAAQKCGITGTHVSVLVDGTDEFELMDHDHEHEHHHDHEHDHDHEHHHDHEHEHDHEHHHDHEHEHDHEHHYDHAHEHHHAYSSLGDIASIVNTMRVSPKVKEDILAVYRLIAEAEGHVHDRPVEQIQIHEVGTLDAVADVTAVCLLMEKLSPDQVIASPVHVGSGTVRCAHGILPVPAPATAYILRDIPIYGGQIRGELCTPTGAALLKHFVSSFGEMPAMKVSGIGYGMGNKDFPVANCVRAMLGETELSSTRVMYELSLNVDDMTAEQIGFAMERIFEAGAVEVFTVPVGMKKSRPGTMLCIICAPQNRGSVVSAVFRHTTTIGIRETEIHRYELERTVERKESTLGPVRIKRSEGFGTIREKMEYEDLAAIAREKGLSLMAVKELLEKEL